MKIVIGCILLAVAMMACGGDGDGERILRLGGGDISEAEFRLDMRTTLLDPIVVMALCEGTKGLSDAEIVAVIVNFQQDAGVELVQEADPEDRERAAGILREECDRVSD